MASAQGRDRELERLLARQNRESGTKPILELNMGHDLVKALATALGEKREADVSDIASLLLDQAHILDGDVPADPAAFARRLNALVVRGLRGGATAAAGDFDGSSGDICRTPSRFSSIPV